MQKPGLKTSAARSGVLPATLTALALALGGATLWGVSSKAQEARALPAPAQDETAGTETARVAVLAGGCFWGVQGVFQHVDGVSNAVSGYAGGDAATAKYGPVGSGRTGHAEAVKITYDPRKISYGRILQIYFSVAHDPTELNRQGPDFGPQYRSAVFPTDAEQARLASAYIAQLDRAKAFPAAIVTKIEPDKPFYPAEGYHQDFLTKNPHHPYIVINDVPKVRNLEKLFGEVYRPEPVLVGTTATN